MHGDPHPPGEGGSVAWFYYYYSRLLPLDYVVAYNNVGSEDSGNKRMDTTECSTCSTNMAGKN